MRYPDFYTPEQIKIGEQNWKNAWKYFKSIGAIPKDATPMRYNLHHKDPTLRFENPDRYILWLPEDLIPLTVSEHIKLHRKLEKEDTERYAEICRKKSESMKQSWTNERRQKQSEITKQWWSEADEEMVKKRNRKTSESMLGKQNAKGSHHSEESKKRTSESMKGNQNAKDKHWFNDGTNQIRAFECPDGFVPGRLLSDESKRNQSEAMKLYWERKRAEKAV